MIIRHQKLFTFGLILLALATALAWAGFAPFFQGRSGVDVVDELMTGVRKNRIEAVSRLLPQVKPFVGRYFRLELTLSSVAESERVALILVQNRIQVAPFKRELSLVGDEGRFMEMVLADARSLFENRPQDLAAKYEQSAQSAMATLWQSLNILSEAFDRAGRGETATFLKRIRDEALEPAWNFQGIQARKPRDNALVLSVALTGLLLLALLWESGLRLTLDAMGVPLTPERDLAETAEEEEEEFRAQKREAAAAAAAAAPKPGAKHVVKKKKKSEAEEKPPAAKSAAETEAEREIAADERHRAETQAAAPEGLSLEKLAEGLPVESEAVAQLKAEHQAESAPPKKAKAAPPAKKKPAPAKPAAPKKPAPETAAKKPAAKKPAKPHKIDL